MNKKIKERISRIRKDGIFVGILTIFMGCIFLITGSSRYGTVTPGASWFIITIGIFVIIYFIFRKPDSAKDNLQSKICGNCGAIYQDEKTTVKCEKCNSELINPKEFLARYPDLTQHKWKPTDENEPNPFLLVFKVILIAFITSIIGVIFFKHVAENL